MPRILVECPITRTPVSTGHRTFTLDMATMEGERSFRCTCGGVHSWSAESAWVEDERSLDQEIAAEMRTFGQFASGDPGEDAAPKEEDLRGRQAREGRAARQANLRPW